MSLSTETESRSAPATAPPGSRRGRLNVTPQTPGLPGRALALLIDVFVLISCGFTLSAVIELIGIAHTPERLMALSMSVAWLPYSVGFLRISGATLGKRLVGLRVIRADGTSVDGRSAFRREIWRVVFAAGIIWPIDYLAALSKVRLTIHDRWSDTRVVYARDRLRVLVPLGSLVALLAVAAGMQFLTHYIARH